jgi:hypothetical protein
MGRALRFVWHFLLGPLLAFLPRRLRERLSFAKSLNWTGAGTVSGIYEIAATIAALRYWYMYLVIRTNGQILRTASQTGADEYQVYAAALFLFYLHPLTWVLFYFFLEGAVRMCAAAFAENVLGSFPIYTAERLIFWLRKPQEARVLENMRENALSFVQSVQEWVMETLLDDVEDELDYSTRAGNGRLEIRSSRRKKEWIKPKIVYVEGVYYQLEESWVGSGKRPFRYQLRRLSAGVPSRSVIVYRAHSANSR